MQKTLQYVFTTITSILASVLGVLYIPVLLLVLCNIIDYITGLVAAKYRPEGGISSYKSVRGIFKKVNMWLLVVVGAIIDELIKYSVMTVGIEMPFTFLVACIVAVWLICNELISILENIKDSGIKLPPFLVPLVNNIKSQAEQQTHEKKEGK